MFCHRCGSPLSASQHTAGENDGENEVASSLDGFERGYEAGFSSGYDAARTDVPEPGNAVRGAANGPRVSSDAFVGQWRRPIRTDRNIVIYVLLSLLTLGFYSWYFIYQLVRDINVMCADDDEVTEGLAVYIVLSFVTCGLYSLYWIYKVANRLAANAPAYGLHFAENGTTVLLWWLVGSLLCGIGPLVAMYFIITNTNRMAEAYNCLYVYGA